jgi:hypothetical protein
MNKYITFTLIHREWLQKIYLRDLCVLCG